MNFLKNTVPFVVAMLLMVSSAIGQGQQMQQQQIDPDSITDEELQTLADIVDESQSIQEETQEELEVILEEEGMEMERFQTIMMSRQNPQMSDSVELTEEEEQTIEEIQPKLMQIQQESQQKFIQVVQDNGMEPQRFQQVMQAVQSNQEVAQRFQKIAADTTEGIN